MKSRTSACSSGLPFVFVFYRGLLFLLICLGSACGPAEIVGGTGGADTSMGGGDGVGGADMGGGAAGGGESQSPAGGGGEGAGGGGATGGGEGTGGGGATAGGNGAGGAGARGCVPSGDLPLPATGKLYFVAPTGGSNANSGTEAKQPLATIQEGIRRAVPGDTVVLRGGTYTQTVHFSNSGTMGKPITLRNYPSEKPVIDNQYRGNAVSLQAINYKTGGAVGWITVEGLEIKNPGNKGIEIVNGHDLVFRRCYVHGARGQGITGNGTRILIDRNVIADNGDFIGAQEHGIYATGTRWTISNNLIYRNAFWGIQVAGYTDPLFYQFTGPEYAGASELLIVNNTFALQHRRSGIVMYHGAKNSTVQNNIFYNNRTGAGLSTDDSGVSFYGSGKGHQLINNLHFGKGPFTSNNAAVAVFSESRTVKADPLFTNLGALDFHLRATSPAKNQGAPLNAPKTDYEGRPRPQGSSPDIGAIELCE